jgi:hypothetical protein
VTRSTRLLAIGGVVLVAALVVLLVSMRSQPDPIIVADAAPDAAAADSAATDGAPDEGSTAAAGTVGELGEDEQRMPSPLELPAGHEAVAVSSSYDAAVAALPVPGDRVNVYAVFQQGLPDELGGSSEGDNATKGVVRALSGVEVLGVSGATVDTGGGNVTLVLALEPDDAERAIYLASTEQVWFTLVDADHDAVEGVGVTRDSVLDATS